MTGLHEVIAQHEWGGVATSIFCRRTWCDKSEISFDERNSLRYSEPIEFEKGNVTRKLIVVETMRFVYCRILRRAWGGEARLFRRVNQSFVIYWYRIEFRSYALTFHIYNWPFVIRASILFCMSDMVMLQYMIGMSSRIVPRLYLSLFYRIKYITEIPVFISFRYFRSHKLILF